MRICDRCGGEVIAEKLVSKIDGVEIDLCTTCNEAFREFLSQDQRGNEETEPRRRGRPPKEK